jgi:hypothetical protein
MITPDGSKYDYGFPGRRAVIVFVVAVIVLLGWKAFSGARESLERKERIIESQQRPR